MSVAEIIKELRIEKNKSQEQLSKETGLSQSAIAKWEKGKTEPTASSLRILAQYFNTTTDYLIGLNNKN